MTTHIKLQSLLFEDGTTYEVPAEAKYDPVERVKQLLEALEDALEMLLSDVSEIEARKRKKTKPGGQFSPAAWLQQAGLFWTIAPAIRDLRRVAIPEMHKMLEAYEKQLKHGSFADLYGALQMLNARLADIKTVTRYALDIVAQEPPGGRTMLLKRLDDVSEYCKELYALFNVLRDLMITGM